MNKEIDNLEKILPFLQFDDPNDFYYLQILQRKKENPQLGSNSRVIKNYYINSKEYLVERYEEIKHLCRVFNARASIRLNRRNYEKVAFKVMQNIANSMANREYSFIKKSYDRACGEGNHEPKATKTWILDWDGEYTYQDLMKLEPLIIKSQPEGLKLQAYIPSKTGVHLLVSPFDARELRKVYPELDIHKNNPTNLFIP